MKNFWVISFIFLTIATRCYPEKKDFFSFSLNNHVYDYARGLDIERIDTFENVHNKEDILRMYVDVFESDKTANYELEYKNGYLIKSINRIYDGSETVYKYDEKNRLIASIPGFHYSYITDTERELYYNGKLRSNQKVFYEKDQMKILEETYTYTIKGQQVHYGKAEYEYTFYGSNVVRFIQKNWNISGELSKFIKQLDFYYDESNRMSKIVSGFGPDDIREVTFFHYDDESNISEIEVYSDNNTLWYKTIFSDYDKKGNWGKAEEYTNSSLRQTVIREIDYKK